MALRPHGTGRRTVSRERTAPQGPRRSPCFPVAGVSASPPPACLPSARCFAFTARTTQPLIRHRHRECAETVGDGSCLVKVSFHLWLLLKLAGGNRDRKKENAHRNPCPGAEHMAGGGWGGVLSSRQRTLTHTHTHTHAPCVHVAGLPTPACPASSAVGSLALGSHGVLGSNPDSAAC